MTVVIVITQRVNEALRARFTSEERLALTQALARGATISVLPPTQIKDAILSSLQNEHPVIALVAEGQAAADFQRDIENTLREKMQWVAVFRVVTTPVPHSPEVSCENIIDITEVPTRVADAIVAFTRMLEEKKSKAVSGADETSVIVPQGKSEEGQEEQGEKTDAVKDKAVREKTSEEKRSPSWWQGVFGKPAEKKRDESNAQERETSVLYPPSSSRGPEQQASSLPSPTPSRQKRRTIVLRHPEIFVCALDGEISRAQEILTRKYHLPVKLVKLHLHQIPMAGVGADQILAVVTERNVEEVRGSAMFILAGGLTPEHAARYLPSESVIVQSFVPEKKIPDAIVRAVIESLVMEVDNLESL